MQNVEISDIVTATIAAKLAKTVIQSKLMHARSNVISVKLA